MTDAAHEKSRFTYSLAQILANEAPPPYSLDDFGAFLEFEHTGENLEYYNFVRMYTEEFHRLAEKYQSVARSHHSLKGMMPSRENLAEGGRLHPSEPYPAEAIAAEAGESGGHRAEGFRERLESKRSIRSLICSSAESDAMIRQILEKILTLYLTPGSDKEINLAGNIRKKLMNEITTKKLPHPDAFKTSIEKVCEMWKTQSYPKFMNTADSRAPAEPSAAAAAHPLADEAGHAEKPSSKKPGFFKKLFKK
ncbi:uncharacterized protein BJ171DRAFT_588897 [Polychytrium aggregatum]|uniref:uncharacterized protein n=1 Tax=Polychytrium aggregatum TaxID=110093 RepID=UPI0022FEDBB3|nr:uncharacterized protein BJ171DRAFT_588897 [Polychytrium aggregatum]KAI9193164.1 hypothetical protein BJ171DRAFT_588897 [Polychytrium aggregatum]